MVGMVLGFRMFQGILLVELLYCEVPTVIELHQRRFDSSAVLCKVEGRRLTD